MNNDVNLSVEQLEKRQKINKIIRAVLSYGFLTLMGIIVIIPFYWMIITALKSMSEIESSNITFFPKEIYWENFALAIEKMDFANLMKNTLIVSIATTTGTVVTTVTAAFALSRLEFKGKNILFMILLSTMMIPGEMMVVTNYITVSIWNWKDTYQVLIVPFMTSVFYIYLLRQTFMQIPNELYYAAKVDGTGDFKYLIRVMVPLAAPTIISIIVLDFMGPWNSYIWPQLVTSKQENRLITNGLRSAFTDTEGRSESNLQMAASILVTLPILVMFVCFRKYIMKGVSKSGIKG